MFKSPQVTRVVQSEVRIPLRGDVTVPFGHRSLIVSPLKC